MSLTQARILLVGWLLLALWAPVGVLAQGTSEFTIQVFGGTDTTSPTVPAGVAGVALAATQAQVTWFASTDNYAVHGYVVYRDGVAVATTSALSLIDSGLVASTSYQYAVQAFDGAGNYSTTSAVVLVQTPMIAPPATGGVGSSGGGTRARTPSLTYKLEPAVRSAMFTITTQRYDRITVRLGRTPGTLDETVVTAATVTGYEAELTGLQPATVYYYEAVGITASGLQRVLVQDQFTTAVADRATLVPNVLDLTATQLGSAVELTYRMPPGVAPGATTRVVRSHFGFSQYRDGGWIIFDGAVGRVIDPSAFVGGQAQQFYTVFVIEPSGAISSGAVVLVENQSPSTPPAAPPATAPSSAPAAGPQTPGAAVATSSDTATTSASPTPPVQPPEQGTTTGALGTGADIQLEQAGVVTYFSTQQHTLSAGQPFTVRVPSTAVTGAFQLLVATLTDPADPSRSFSFLLRLTEDKTAYLGTVAAIERPGTSTLAVQVYDYETQVVATYDTTVVFTPVEAAPLAGQVWYWRVWSGLWYAALALPVLLLAGLWWLFAVRYRDDDEDNNRL